MIAIQAYNSFTQNITGKFLKSGKIRPAGRILLIREIAGEKIITLRALQIEE